MSGCKDGHLLISYVIFVQFKLLRYKLNVWS